MKRISEQKQNILLLLIYSTLIDILGICKEWWLNRNRPIIASKSSEVLVRDHQTVREPLCSYKHQEDNEFIRLILYYVMTDCFSMILCLFISAHVYKGCHWKHIRKYESKGCRAQYELKIGSKSIQLSVLIKTSCMLYYLLPLLIAERTPHQNNKNDSVNLYCFQSTAVQQALYARVHLDSSTTAIKFPPMLNNFMPLQNKTARNVVSLYQESGIDVGFRNGCVFSTCFSVPHTFTVQNKTACAVDLVIHQESYYLNTVGPTLFGSILTSFVPLGNNSNLTSQSHRAITYLSVTVFAKRHSRDINWHAISHSCSYIYNILLIVSRKLAIIETDDNSMATVSGGLKREQRQKSLSPLLIQLQGSPNSGYCAMISIGVTMPQEFCVLIDTGSSNLAVAANPHPDINQYFDVSRVDSNYENIGKSVSVSYTGSKWSGTLAKDRIAIGGSQSVEAYFALISSSDNFFIKNAQWVGIMGLAYSSLAKPDYYVETYWDSLRNTNGEWRDIFVIQFCPPLNSPDVMNNSSTLNAQGGFLAFGEVSESLYSGPIHYTSIVEEHFYNVLLTNLTVGHIAIDIPCSQLNDDQTIVDSGTTDIFLPKKSFSAVKSAFIEHFKDGYPLVVPESFWSGGAKLAWPSDDRHSIFKSFPTVHIGFALHQDESSGFSLGVTSQIYLRQVQGTEEDSTKTSCGPSCEYYVFGIKERERGTIIGGNVILGFTTIFDREERRIGFAKSNCRYQDDEDDTLPYIVGPYAREPIDCKCYGCTPGLSYWEIASYTCGAVVFPIALFSILLALYYCIMRCYKHRKEYKFKSKIMKICKHCWLKCCRWKCWCIKIKTRHVEEGNIELLPNEEETNEEDDLGHRLSQGILVSQSLQAVTKSYEDVIETSLSQGNDVDQTECDIDPDCHGTTPEEGHMQVPDDCLKGTLVVSKVAKQKQHNEQEACSLFASENCDQQLDHDHASIISFSFNESNESQNSSQRVYSHPTTAKLYGSDQPKLIANAVAIPHIRPLDEQHTGSYMDREQASQCSTYRNNNMNNSEARDFKDYVKDKNSIIINRISQSKWESQSEAGVSGIKNQCVCKSKQDTISNRSQLKSKGAAASYVSKDLNGETCDNERHVHFESMSSDHSRSSSLENILAVKIKGGISDLKENDLYDNFNNNDEGLGDSISKETIQTATCWYKQNSTDSGTCETIDENQNELDSMNNESDHESACYD